MVVIVPAADEEDAVIVEKFEEEEEIVGRCQLQLQLLDVYSIPFEAIKIW